jgi:hypothetical protein
MTMRVGMRSGDLWLLTPNKLFDEKTGSISLVEGPPLSGTTPKIPSIKAAVLGVRKAYPQLVMGTDPEFFVTRAGRVVPAFDFLPDKYTTSDGLFWDGFQAETTIDLWWYAPVTERGNPSYAVRCHAILAQVIGRQLGKLRDHGLNIAPQSVWRIPPDMLKFASEGHVALGCDPSRNAYGMHGRLVERPRELGWRFAGGHIHFNMSAPERGDRNNVRYIVKTLDALLGIPSVCLAQNFDHFIRRRYYGLAGEYRLPLHGLEYRTLSNFWEMDPKAFDLVFDLARHAFNVGKSRLRNIFVGSETAIRDTINFCDVRSAKDFMKLNREFYTAWTDLTYANSKPFWEAIDGGIDKVIPNWGKDVVKAWHPMPGDWRDVPGWKDLQ